MTGDDPSARLVDGLNATYGVHPGYRAAHAKGVLCAATFVPTAEASALSRAPHLAGPPDGIVLTRDPILLARPGAYSVSVARRLAGQPVT